MRFLVTGGIGFIGYHLSKYLLEKGHNVTVIDNLFRGEMDEDATNLLKNMNIEFINSDLTEEKSLKKLLKRYDYVIHLAAINGTKYFYEIPHVVLRTNILSLLRILDWMTELECRNILFSSSSEVYGGTIRRYGGPIPTPEEISLTIDDEFNPRLSYAISKIVGEMLCINYARKHKLNYQIIRYHNIYGPRMGYEHVIPQLILKILKKEDPIKIQGGNQTRAFCFIEDAVEATYKILLSSECNNQIVNIGNDREEISIKELIEKLFNISGFHSGLKTLPIPQGSVKRRCPDITKIHELIGWTPKINLNVGLQKTYNWYKKHYYKIGGKKK